MSLYEGGAPDAPLPDHRHQQHQPGDDDRPDQRVTQRGLPIEATRRERADRQNEPSDQCDDLDDLELRHGVTSKPSYPTTTPFGTSADKVL